MVIPVPERFPPKYVAMLATALLIVQLLEGTDPLFALLCFLYILIFAAAFNFSGGIYHPSGAYIFMNGLLTVMVALVYKAILVEPAHTHLQVPNITMAVYCVGMAMLGVCGYVVRRLRPARGLLANTSRGEQMKRAAIACLVLGLALQFISLGSLQSVVAQVNHFPRMALILGTVYAIQSSGGRKSSNWIVWVSSLYLTATGLLYFSKEGIFLAATTWIVPVVVLRFNLSRFQLVVGGLLIVFSLYYLVPYSQYGRRGRDPDSSSPLANLDAAMLYLGDLNETRRLYLEETQARDISQANHYFDTDQGLFDRLEMLTPDDALIKYTLDGNQEGIMPSLYSLYGVIPHFLWADKPFYFAGNTYGRELGIIDQDDTDTGISFSPFSDAFHQIGWPGLIILLPLTIFPLFYIADSLSGDVREAPWGLLYIALFVHVAPEGLLAGAVYTAVYGTEGVVLVAVLVRYILPVFSTLMMGELRRPVTVVTKPSPARRSGASLLPPKAPLS